MRAFVGTIALMGLVTLATGCDALLALIAQQPTTVNVSFVNTSADYTVQVDYYYSDQDDIPRDLLTSDLGERRNFTVPAGETFTFPLLCDDAQAMVVDDSDLLIVGGAGPEDNTDVLYDGEDFHCGDTITFTFSHSDLLLDFEVRVTAEATPTDNANANGSTGDETAGG